MTPYEIKIEPIDPRSPRLQVLAAEASEQGYAFIDRLIHEAASGETMFQNEGERFCGAFADGALVGCGGVNRDPYVDQWVGRLRHVYVLAAYRRLGIAAALVRDLLERSRSSFGSVRLRTADETAGRFYGALGFGSLDHDSATHFIEL